MSWAICLIQVAVGLIFNCEGSILIAKRPLHKYQGGLWEFPGGKVEMHETVFDALRRELREELGIEVVEASQVLQIPYAYLDREIVLDVWKVTNFHGEVSGKENQPILWVEPKLLSQYEFPEANVRIIKAIKKFSMENICAYNLVSPSNSDT